MALVRAHWLIHTSYRMGVILSFIALAGTIVPVYFVADALQPVVGESIREEGGHYFAFLVMGIASIHIIGAALTALPGAVSGGIQSGTLEALFCTPASITSILCGLVGYQLLWAGVRAFLLLLAIVPLGGEIFWRGFPPALGAAFLTTCAYFAVGLMAAALVLVFRTAGPLVHGVIAASSLLGGVYYSTTVIPAPFEWVAMAIPLTYGLRVARRSLLEAAPLESLRVDGLALFGLTTLLMIIGIAAFSLALDRSRRMGSLGQY